MLALCIWHLGLVLLEATGQEPRLPEICSQLSHKAAVWFQSCNFELLYGQLWYNTQEGWRLGSGCSRVHWSVTTSVPASRKPVKTSPRRENICPFAFDCSWFSSHTEILASNRYAELLQNFSVMLSPLPAAMATLRLPWDRACLPSSLARLFTFLFTIYSSIVLFLKEEDFFAT